MNMQFGDDLDVTALSDSQRMIDTATAILALFSDERAPLPDLLDASVGILADATTAILCDILGSINEQGPESTEDVAKLAASPAKPFHIRAEEALERAVGVRFDGGRGDAPQDARLVDFLALITATAKLLQRRIAAVDPDEEEETARFLSCLFSRNDVHIGRAIKHIYDPKVPLPINWASLSRANPWVVEDNDINAWEELDFDQLRFHRAGTTSMILTCTKTQAHAADSGSERILKCVLFPWVLVSAVSESTAEYSKKYKDTKDAAVPAEFSTAKWVIMPKADGATLLDWYRNELGTTPSGATRIEIASRVAVGVCSALDRLSRSSTHLGQSISIREVEPARQHLDLSPSNIMVESIDEEGLRFRFIDLGPNHLYSRQVGMADHDDAVYVAPEVKNRNNASSSDIYSLAVILTEILSGTKPRDGRLPDSVYELSPLLGRLLDDALEDVPERRLVLLPENTTFCDYRECLRATFDLVKCEPVSIKSRTGRIYANISPGSRELKSLYGKWRAERNMKAAGWATHFGYLTFSSLAAVAAWGWIFLRCGLFSFDELLAGRSPELPTGTRLAAQLIGFSQGMVAIKYYQYVFARLSTWRIKGLLAKATEVSMRAVSLVALPTTLFAVMWRPSLWAWTCALGAVLVALTNFLAYRLSKNLMKTGAALQLSTVPVRSGHLPGAFDQWWWTMLMYALVIAVIAIGLESGWMHDQGAYVFGLLVISFGIHYLSKCVSGGPQVRGGIARAFAIGERVDILQGLSSRGSNPAGTGGGIRGSS